MKFIRMLKITIVFLIVLNFLSAIFTTWMIWVDPNHLGLHFALCCVALIAVWVLVLTYPKSKGEIHDETEQNKNNTE